MPYPRGLIDIVVTSIVWWNKLVHVPLILSYQFIDWSCYTNSFREKLACLSFEDLLTFYAISPPPPFLWGRGVHCQFVTQETVYCYDLKLNEHMIYINITIHILRDVPGERNILDQVRQHLHVGDKVLYIYLIFCVLFWNTPILFVIVSKKNPNKIRLFIQYVCNILYNILNLYFFYSHRESR